MKIGLVHQSDLSSLGDYRPKALLRKKNDSEAIAAITEFMNNISGGNKYLQGDIDISPQTIAYLVAYGTGGLGRTTGRTGQLVFDGIAEIAERGFGYGQGAVRKRELNQIPFIRRLLAVPEDHVTSKLYYDAKIDVESYAQAYLRNENDISVDPRVAQDMIDARPNIMALTDTITLAAPQDRSEVDASIEEVNKNSKSLNEELATNEENKKINPRFYYQQQERIEEEILREQKRFIKIYNRAIAADKKEKEKSRNK